MITDKPKVELDLQWLSNECLAVLLSTLDEIEVGDEDADAYGRIGEELSNRVGEAEAWKLRKDARRSLANIARAHNARYAASRAAVQAAEDIATARRDSDAALWKMIDEEE